MKKLIRKFALLCVTSFMTANLFSQSQGAFGFTSTQVALSSNTVKAGTNKIITATHVYFINNSDSKIYDVVWDVATSTWTTSTAPLGGTTCPAVKTGTNIVNFGDEIYFVSATDSKIYRLKWTFGPGWQFNIVNTTQVAVAGNNIFLRSHAPSAGWDIYYIGTGGKICQIYFDGTTYGPGVQLVAGQTANALTTSPLVVSNTTVYYICSTDNKIYRVYWSSGWTGGTVPLVSTSTAVRNLSNIVNENNDLDHLYYVNTSNQICELINTGSWTYSLISVGYTVRTNTDIVCSFGSVFYVRSSDWKVCRVWKTGTWNNELLKSTAASVASNTQLFVWANDIIEETTVSSTFKSFHVFYNNGNKINMLVYDDNNVPFTPFGCFDNCDSNGNGTGWDDPFPNTSSTPHPGYECSLYNVGGIKAKSWYYGKIPMGSVNINLTFVTDIAVLGKHFYFVGSDSKIYDFMRSPLNGTVKAGYGSLNWSDEFNASGLNTSFWNTSFSWGNHVPGLCYDNDWVEPTNVSQNGTGTLKLTTDNLISWHILGPMWWGGCGYGMYTGPLKKYGFNTSLITSEGKKMVSQGYTEARFQIPRSNRLWPAFWFPVGGQQDINFEFDGNGKPLLCTLYDPTQPYNPGVTNYAVGFRYYDDYYTYGMAWSTDSVIYYLNNERIGAIANVANHCQTPREAIFSVEVSDVNIHAACVPEIFPNYYNIDYIRFWNPAGHSPNPFEPQSFFGNFKLFPNPAQNEITISGDLFSKAEIYNVQGEKIMESNSKIINIDDLSNGIYIIKIIDLNGQPHNSKFIKE